MAEAPLTAPAEAPCIRIEGARSHNLRGVDCSIPLRALTVVTGVSGSGKSTLAFDTLYAEGQRRYVASLSTYARNFLERLPRPEVDAISHLPPAIAIEQHKRVTGARATVGSATEILDHLRLLYARVGEVRCPECGEIVEAATVQSVADRLLAAHEGERLVLAAPLLRRTQPGRARSETPRQLRERLAREGFTRLLDAEGGLHDVVETPLRRLAVLRRDALLVIDRFVARARDHARAVEAVANAFARGGGELVAVDADGARERYREGFGCRGCGRAFRTPEPALFSSDSPLGACPECQGFGRVAALDLDRLVPDPARSLEEDAIAPFATKMGRAMSRDMLRAARAAGVPTDVAWEALGEAGQRFVIEGDEGQGGDWYGVRGFFEWLESRRYKVQARVLIARYRRFETCPACVGMRLRPEALAVRVGGLHLGEVSRLPVSALSEFVGGLGDRLDASARARVARLLPLLRDRIAVVDEVGLGYVTLDRQLRTLSGGETQRIQLASALAGTLTSTLYVLDEPSVGLHAQDIERLLGVLRRIRDHGNTVVVVEHTPEIVSAADHIVDLGPGAGREGGQVVAQGSVAQLRASAASQTGRALRGELRAEQRVPRPPARGAGTLRIVGARAHNLDGVDVALPLGCLVAVTGVSGAGKTTLVRNVLVGELTRDPDRGHCDEIIGRERVREVVVVDQTPAARSPRSNPATVTRAFDALRARFAATREAKRRGFGPGWFSFNVAGGRCEVCEGEGEVVIDMHFLDDVRVPCESCGGLRYRREVLEVEVEGRNIVDVLALPIDEALEVFASDRKIVARLQPVREVGLGYLTLGQPLSTLSGGENQRLRLALALGERQPGALYVLDEPTRGLHPADVQVLVGCLDRLVANGSSVVVVEHDLALIAQADHVIDLGPEGGPGGGRIVAQGRPADVAAVKASATGQALRRHLAEQPPRGPGGAC